MKVVHVLKKIDTIDQDIKELRKLEKSLAKDKSFTTPIYISIEKQINIMLGERIKLLELKIENPPESFIEEIEGAKPEQDDEANITKIKSKSKSSPKKKSAKKNLPDLDEEIPMLTQDQIDQEFDKAEKKKTKSKTTKKEEEKKQEVVNAASVDDESVKLLDIALEKGTLEKKEIEVEKEKKVKFFRENFPSE